MPTWPGGDERGRRVLTPRRPPSGYVSARAFGISLGANVALLVGLLGLLLLSHAAGQSSPGGSAPGSALGAPTATVTAASSPSPSAGWLRVAPSSVQLGCGDGQQSQVVTLENTGPNTAKWQVTFSVPLDQAGVTVSPRHGSLPAGASMPIQIQINTHDSGASNQQGVIGFTPSIPDAGAPASLSYTAASCQ